MQGAFLVETFAFFAKYRADRLPVPVNFYQSPPDIHRQPLLQGGICYGVNIFILSKTLPNEAVVRFFCGAWSFDSVAASFAADCIGSRARFWLASFFHTTAGGTWRTPVWHLEVSQHDCFKGG